MTKTYTFQKIGEEEFIRQLDRIAPAAIDAIRVFARVRPGRLLQEARSLGLEYLAETHLLTEVEPLPSFSKEGEATQLEGTAGNLLRPTNVDNEHTLNYRRINPYTGDYLADICGCQLASPGMESEDGSVMTRVKQALQQTNVVVLAGADGCGRENDFERNLVEAIGQIENYDLGFPRMPGKFDVETLKEAFYDENASKHIRKLTSLISDEYNVEPDVRHRLHVIPLFHGQYNAGKEPDVVGTRPH